MSAVNGAGRTSDNARRRVLRHALCLTVMAAVLASSGCSKTRVQVDTRVTQDTALWERLDGPDYVIRGPDEPIEASLAFQEFASVLQRALEARRPDLRRVPRGEPANLVLTMHVEVADRGVGVASYPVYGRMYGYRRVGPGPAYRYGGTYYAGNRFESYHLGFACRLVVSANIHDAGTPAGHKVLWEGSASLVSEAPDPDPVLPYLATALVEYYAQATGGSVMLKFDDDDDGVRVAAGDAQYAVEPAPMTTAPHD